MFRLNRLLLAGFMTAASSQAAWAEGLLDIYRQAAATDPQLKSAEATRLANREIKPQARALLLPEINASGQQTREFDIKASGFSTPSNVTTHNYSVNLTQPLFRLGSWVQYRQADSIVNQADADLRVAQQDLVLRVAQRYFGVLSAQDALSFATAEKEAIARQLEQARRRFEVGLITITDVQEAKARYDLSVANEVNARNVLSDAWEGLREVTGQYYQRLDPLGDELPLKPPEPADPDVWAKRALEVNPQLVSAGFAVEVARENVNLQRSGHYPTLDLIAGYNDTDSGIQESSGNSIGLQLNLPLYQGGAVVSRTREAAYNYEAAKQNLETQQRAIVRQTRNAYWAVQAAVSRVQANRQARVSNESSLEATQAGYDVGTRTIVDVLNAQSDLFMARRDYAQSRYDYIISMLTLIQAAGQLSQADLEKVSQWLGKSAKANGSAGPKKARRQAPASQTRRARQ